MDWKLLIQDLLGTGMTQKSIAVVIGASDSLITEILNGDIKKMYWERGDKLIDLHAKHCGTIANRSAKRQGADANG